MSENIVNPKTYIWTCSEAPVHLRRKHDAETGLALIDLTS
jgi:hypothetical protein